MAGIYVHIPFCTKRCSYCNFYSSTCFELRQNYVKALVAEISSRQNFFPANETIDTLYFGGGTPSVLGIRLLDEIFNAISKHFNLASLKEFTVECNPDDIDIDFARGLIGIQANRVSMGIQSFDDEELKLLNRRHDVAKAVKAVEACKNAGFSNISIDLMYGLPGQTLSVWEQNINKAVELQVQHISSYCLSFEKNTPMYKLRAKQPSDIMCEEMYYLLCQKMHENGFEHYEISNFALSGYRSQHNYSYWRNVPYLGLGPAAHSFNGTQRRQNVANINKYISSALKGQVTHQSETLDAHDKYNELIMTSLRTSEGLDSSLLAAEYKPYFEKVVKKFLKSGGVIEKNGVYFLNEKKYFVSDFIIRELFF